MLKEVNSAIRMLILMTVVLGVIYPLGMTGVAQVIFPEQANGSLIYKQGSLVGSKLIGQNFSSEGYFHGRPSAAGDDGYDAASSAGSNLGPTSKKLLSSIAERSEQIRLENGLAENAIVPSDLVTASGSGLDPHITVAAAQIQAQRVAKARNLTEAQTLALIEKNTENPQIGFLGEKRVNVLSLNLALDEVTK
ncbi:MAG: K+-transporting ATPase, subunit [Massilibacillus sp.]|jgi:K+-transporting ATPase ATPase C chain|nr:K+-transporting ATPase, subunit [Massilibacillus sp.]